MLVRGTDMLLVVREVQIPLLAVLLIGGGTAKAHRAITRHPAGPETGPAGMFPPWLRGAVAIGLPAIELTLGAGLLATAGDSGGGLLVPGIRTAAAVLFCVAAAALHELRARRPEAGCGCFGDLSGTPVSWRTIARALLLSAAALATVGGPPLRMPGSPALAAVVLAVVAAELTALAALSPEVGAVMIRLGNAEPCEVRRVPVARTLRILRASGLWRRYRARLLSATPTDVWREGCWRFLVFPGVLANRRVDVVFAVYLTGRHGPVRAGSLARDDGTARYAPARGTLHISNRV